MTGVLAYCILGTRANSGEPQRGAPRPHPEPDGSGLPEGGETRLRIPAGSTPLTESGVIDVLPAEPEYVGVIPTTVDLRGCKHSQAGGDAVWLATPRLSYM